MDNRLNGSRFWGHTCLPWSSLSNGGDGTVARRRCYGNAVNCNGHLQISTVVGRLSMFTNFFFVGGFHGRFPHALIIYTSGG
jgi:hypothetical protein